MTSSRARAASSCEGVTGDVFSDATFVLIRGNDGTGGGCIELVLCVGDTCISFSTVKDGRISIIGESSAVLLRYLGVRASDDAGGDIYCSIPTSIGNVWLRGLWKLLLPGCPLACWLPIKGFGPHAESGVKKGDDNDVGLVGPAENDEAAVSVKTLDKDAML
jgi:hypothetical protein